MKQVVLESDSSFSHQSVWVSSSLKLSHDIEMVYHFRLRAPGLPTNKKLEKRWSEIRSALVGFLCSCIFMKGALHRGGRCCT